MPHDTVSLLLDRLAAAPPDDRLALRKAKADVAARTGGRLIRNDALLARYREDVAAGARTRDVRLERALMLNAIRSESGVATVTVGTGPYAWTTTPTARCARAWRVWPPPAMPPTRST